MVKYTIAPVDNDLACGDEVVVPAGNSGKQVLMSLQISSFLQQKMHHCRLRQRGRFEGKPMGELPLGLHCRAER